MLAPPPRLASACVLLSALAGCPSSSNRGAAASPQPSAAPPVENVILKDDKVFVRTYYTDAVLSVN